MNTCSIENWSLLADLYELTMAQGYYFHKRNLNVVFEMFYRQQPFGGGYAVFAGLETLSQVLLNLHFDDADLSYLSTLKLFKPEFIRYLSRFRFTGDVYSVEEGEIVFPKEPLIRVHANIIEAQFIESILLNIINFQTLIATKAARMSNAAQGTAIMEFGLRRAQGFDGALSATRAAYIGGAAVTSNLLGGKMFNIPVAGTMAHSWVMAFDSQYDAFEKYAALYPEHTVLLVDTYDTLAKGVPQAIRVLKKLKKAGFPHSGIRIDSGDLEYLSKRARTLLDKAHLQETKIYASNELDEHIVEQLIQKKAPIDYFGVGTKLVTADSSPALSGVYKLVARQHGRGYVPVIKVSDDATKISNPHIKNILRTYDRDGLMLGDLIFLEQENNTLKRKVNQTVPLMFYHPEISYKSFQCAGYGSARALLQPIILRGGLQYDFTDLKTVQKKTRDNLRSLHPTYRRLLNPHQYKVSLTKKLRDLKLLLIQKCGVSKSGQRQHRSQHLKRKHPSTL